MHFGGFSTSTRHLQKTGIRITRINSIRLDPIDFCCIDRKLLEIKFLSFQSSCSATIAELWIKFLSIHKNHTICSAAPKMGWWSYSWVQFTLHIISKKCLFKSEKEKIGCVNNTTSVSMSYSARWSPSWIRNGGHFQFGACVQIRQKTEFVRKKLLKYSQRCSDSRFRIILDRKDYVVHSKKMLKVQR